MRAARASLLLAAAVLLASALHLSFALPADMTAEAEAAAAVRDPEEYPTEEKPEKPESPGYHFPTIPRPSEIIHAVGNYVHGGNHQQQAEQVEEHEHHHRPPTTHRPPLHQREKPKIKVTKTVLVEVRLSSFPPARTEPHGALRAPRTGGAPAEFPSSPSPLRLAHFFFISAHPG